MKYISNALCLVFFILLSQVLTLKISGTAIKILPESQNNENKILPHESNFLQIQQPSEQFVNQWVRIKNMNSNKCIKLGGAGQRLLQEDCGNVEEFYWILLKNTDDQSYLIISKKGNLLFDNSGNHSNNGNPILSVGINANESQRWFVSNLEDNSFKIFNKNNNKCINLSDGNTNNGPFFNLWDCNSSDKNQAYEFELQYPTCRGSSNKIDLYTKPVRIINKKTQKCLKIVDSSSIKLFDCNTVVSFFWHLDKNDDGTHTIRSMTGDYVFHISNGDKKNGNKVETARKEGSDHQKFKLLDFNYSKHTFYIRDKNSDKCLSIPESNPSNEIQIFECSKTNFSQEFSFEVTKPFIAKDEIRDNYLGKLIRIKSVDRNLCLKYVLNSWVILEACKNVYEQGFKLVYNDNDNTYYVNYYFGNYHIRSGSCGGNVYVGNYYNTNDSEYSKWHIDVDENRKFYFKSKPCTSYCLDFYSHKTYPYRSTQVCNPVSTSNEQEYEFEVYEMKQHNLLSTLIGKNVIIRNPKTNRCLSYTKQNEIVPTYECYQLAKVTWKLSYNPTDYTYTISTLNGIIALSSKEERVSNGNNLITSNFVNNKYQKFKIDAINNDSNSPFIMYSTDTDNFCVSISSDLANTLYYTCNPGDERQLFTFEIIDPHYNTNKAKELFGKWYKIQNEENEKCLELSSDNKLELATCTEFDDQAWMIVEKGFQTYTIVSKTSSLAFDLSSDNYNNNSPIVLSKISDNQSQKWTIVSLGGKKWKILDSKYGRSISVISGSNIQLYDSSNTKTQTFVFLLMGERAKIRGTIKYADKSSSIPYCFLLFQKLIVSFTNGKNVIYADINKDGTYEVKLPMATYERSITMKNYYSINDKVKISGPSDETNLSNSIYLSPVIDGWRVVLVWEKAPGDMTSVLVDPNGGIVKLQTNYQERALGYIDQDPKNSYGPQTVTFRELLKEGTYKFYVNNFSKDGLLSESKARLYVYRGKDFSQVIYINTETHPNDYYWWHVFEVDGPNNKFNVVNKVKNSYN